MPTGLISVFLKFHGHECGKGDWSCNNKVFSKKGDNGHFQNIFCHMAS